MSRIVALVGRPNVGKSTLFNRMTRSRRAIVSDYEGVTRDRYYAKASFQDQEYFVVDTGGLSSFYGEDVIASYAARQTLCAIQEADAVFFMVDARAGLLPEDIYISDQLRQYADKVYLVINKADFKAVEWVASEFYTLGFRHVCAISAEHDQGVDRLLSQLFSDWRALGSLGDSLIVDEEVPGQELGTAISVALIGRPNVGKSSFINAILGEERCIVSPIAGTTRDSVEVHYTYRDRECTFIDTCGMRRRSRIKKGSLENFSLIKTLRSVQEADVVILMLDITSTLSDQDIHLASRVAEEMKSLVVCINKCDAVSSEEKALFMESVARSLYFIDYGYFCYTSVKKRKGLLSVLDYALRAYDASYTKFQTSRLMKMLQQLVIKQQPPRAGLFRPKMKYIHQGGMHPPHVIIHGNGLDALPETYIRYIKSHLHRELSLKGVPLKISFKSSENPYMKQRSEKGR